MCTPALHSRDILCGDLGYNSSHGILLPKYAAQKYSHLAAWNMQVQLTHAAEASVGTADLVAMCGLHLWWVAFWRLSEYTQTDTRTVAVKNIQISSRASPFQHPAYKSKQKEIVVSRGRAEQLIPGDAQQKWNLYAARIPGAPFLNEKTKTGKPKWHKKGFSRKNTLGKMLKSHSRLAANRSSHYY